MAGPDGSARDRLTQVARLRERPWEHDFYQVLRRVEALHPDLPRLGEARRPADEPVRVGQAVELDFAPANVCGVEPGPGGRPRILVRFLGFWGPQGPLPLHLTEFARERQRNFEDATLVRFADVFHHRLLLLFYRAWRRAQPAASRDRPADDRFREYVGALFGHGMPQWRSRDAVSDEARRHYAGILSRSVRNAEGLSQILAGYLRVPVRVEPFDARWMRLAPEQRTRLGTGLASSQLGVGAVAGARVLDAQHHCRLTIGPMRFDEYENLLPRGAWHAKLVAWVREYLGEELFVRTALFVERQEARPARLSGHARLGRTAWLGRSSGDGPVAGARFDLTLPAG